MRGQGGAISQTDVIVQAEKAQLEGNLARPEDAAGFIKRVAASAVYDGAMESSFRHPPHQQLLKGQTMISETLKHRR